MSDESPRTTGPEPADFSQEPPALANQYRDDRVLRTTLARKLPAEVLDEVRPDLERMGERAGGDLYRRQLEDRLREPELVRWDAWGRRVDRIELTPLWKEAAAIAAEEGLVALPYEGEAGSVARLRQFALVHLFTPSTDIYSCPLAMTDGAVRTLLDSGHDELVRRAVPRLISRDPATAWTSGQWMTETSGGSDVGRSRTEARRTEAGWTLWGRKWFTSATTSQMALTLARPEGNGPGGRGLALFYVEPRDEEGRPRGVRILRLKDKLGTRKVPTAELLLEGVPATPVAGLEDGVRRITPMLNVTRLWNSVSAVSLMRRGLALAGDYARRRIAFGAPLARKPLHVDTLAGLQAEYEAGFQLVFRVVELLGRAEAGEPVTDLLRVLTPVVKLTTGKQAVAVTSEILEAFGGAGYVEDTGLPLLLRDAQVLPIWEGTTNVLSLDLLRALGGDGLALLREESDKALEHGRVDGLDAPAQAARAGLETASAWWREAGSDRERLEGGARRFALTVGRSLALGALVEHAAWCARELDDPRPAAAARRFAAHGVDRIAGTFRTSDARLLGPEPGLDSEG